MPAHFLERNWSVAHTTRGRDGRQEGRECGYYNLHRHLNDPLFHSFCALMSLFIIHYSLFTIHYSLAKRSERLVFVEVCSAVAT